MNVISVYLREIARFPILTESEVFQLVKRIREGDYEARDQLIRSNLRLVVSVARKIFKSKNVSLMDVIQEGSIGLSRAVESYDPSFGTRFSTYAIYWIKQSIRRFLSQDVSIKIPKYMLHFLSLWKKVEDDFRVRFNRLPTREEMKSKLNLRKGQWKNLLKAKRVQFFNVASREDEQSWFWQVLAGKIPDSIFFLEEKVAVKKVLNNLTSVQQFVIKHRFGLGGMEQKTLEEVGKLFIPAITKERVRQIQRAALEVMSDLLQKGKERITTKCSRKCVRTP